MEIYRVFRKRCIGKNHYILLAIAFLFFAVMTYHVMNDDRIAFLSLFTSPKRIEAGEDLEKYCRYEVVCDIPCVLANENDFFVFEEDVSEEEEPSNLFVGLDKNGENPFLFYVDGEGACLIAQDMAKKTMEGKTSKFDKITIEGYVAKMPKEDASRYIKGLKAYYGETAYSDAEEVYCITPYTFYWNWERLELEYKIFIWLFSIFSLAIVLFIVQRLYTNVGLKQHMKKWNTDENEVNEDFVHAWEASDNFWVGDDYTFLASNDSAMMFPNRAIVWIYKETFSRKNRDMLVFYTLDKRRYTKYVDKSMTECILSYYEKHNPDALVNQYNNELFRLFKENYDAFLEMKYRKN